MGSELGLRVRVNPVKIARRKFTAFINSWDGASNDERSRYR